MDKRAAEREISYQLLKLLLKCLIAQNKLTVTAAEQIRRDAVEELNPIIGCLDDEDCYE